MHWKEEGFAHHSYNINTDKFIQLDYYHCKEHYIIHFSYSFIYSITDPKPKCISSIKKKEHIPVWSWTLPMTPSTRPRQMGFQAKRRSVAGKRVHILWWTQQDNQSNTGHSHYFLHPESKKTCHNSHNKISYIHCSVFPCYQFAILISWPNDLFLFRALLCIPSVYFRKSL